MNGHRIATLFIRIYTTNEQDRGKRMGRPARMIDWHFLYIHLLMNNAIDTLNAYSWLVWLLFGEFPKQKMIERTIYHTVSVDTQNIMYLLTI